MLSVLAAVLALGACSVVATNYTNDPLPPTLELIALHAGSLSPAGCILSSGNFTTDTMACFPFRAFPLPSRPGLSELTVAGAPCGTDRTLNCPSDDSVTGIFTERVGLLAVYTGNTETRFSVNSLDGGGYNSVDLPIGVPLIIGSFGAIRLVLQVKAVSG